MAKRRRYAAGTDSVPAVPKRDDPYHLPLYPGIPATVRSPEMRQDTTPDEDAPEPPMRWKGRDSR